MYVLVITNDTEEFYDDDGVTVIFNEFAHILTDKAEQAFHIPQHAKGVTFKISARVYEVVDDMKITTDFRVINTITGMEFKPLWEKFINEKVEVQVENPAPKPETPPTPEPATEEEDSEDSEEEDSDSEEEEEEDEDSDV